MNNIEESKNNIKDEALNTCEYCGSTLDEENPAIRCYICSKPMCLSCAGFKGNKLFCNDHEKYVKEKKQIEGIVSIYCDVHVNWQFMSIVLYDGDSTASLVLPNRSYVSGGLLSAVILYNKPEKSVTLYFKELSLVIEFNTEETESLIKFIEQVYKDGVTS